VADELARGLKLNMAYVAEYIEYNDQTPESQGDHGNAILSPFPLSDVRALRLKTVFSWTRWGWLEGQPRFGERVALSATITLPDGKKVRVYSCHLESNADSIRRWPQMREVMEDQKTWDMPAVIGGDLNELAGGVIFVKAPEYELKNAFADDHEPTGACVPKNGRIKCSMKIDWILFRGLSLLDRGVDYPLNSEGRNISDHAPISALFKM
jgi:endonuclease/exonuclease/phosphatase family metal-dependent hydrolase